MTEPIIVRRGMRVFVLTGAGISAESGIPTFRDSNGLWESHRVEDVASPEGWEANPALVWRFYSERRRGVRQALPNPGHRALARLEAHLGDGLYLCTQNVDRLHEAAGSRRVFHMHGELFKSRCSNPSCSLEPFVDEALYLDPEHLPRCGRCESLIRPHIVWFGEVPFGLHEAKRSIQEADLFLTVGSSGVVFPAAGFVGEIVYRRQMGEACRALYVGLEAPANASRFQEIRLGPSGEVLPGLFHYAS